MLMISDVAKYLINVISEYGDLPCVLEHHKKNDEDDTFLDPLVNMPVVTIYQEGNNHQESCILFTNRSVLDMNTTEENDVEGES